MDDFKDRVGRIQRMKFLCSRCKNNIVELLLGDPGDTELAELESMLEEYVDE